MAQGLFCYTTFEDSDLHQLEAIVSLDKTPSDDETGTRSGKTSRCPCFDGTDTRQLHDQYLNARLSEPSGDTRHELSVEDVSLRWYRCRYRQCSSMHHRRGR